MARLQKPNRQKPPVLARLTFELCAPRDLEEEMVRDLEDKYQSWAVPNYGKLAPIWAYIQALRAVIIVIKDFALELAEKIRKFAP